MSNPPDMWNAVYQQKAETLAKVIRQQRRSNYEPDYQEKLLLADAMLRSQQELSASESKLSGVTQLCISHQERADTAEEELAAARKALEEIASNSTIPISIARNALRALSSKEPEGER